LNPATAARTNTSAAVRFLLVAGLALVVLAPAAAATGEETGSAGRQTDDAVPDVVLAVAADSPSSQQLDALIAELEGVRGVAWVDADPTATATSNLLVGFDSSSDEPLEAVEAVVAGRPDGSGIAIAGRAVVDRDLDARIGRGVIAGVVLATLAAAAVVLMLAGWARAAVAGSSVAISGWLGATLGAMAAGPFDGSIATTPVPAALAGIVVSGCLVLRLVAWYQSPRGDDQADMIRQSIGSLGAELTLFFSGLIVVAVFLELMGPSRSVATVVLAGASTAAVLTLAIVPLALAGLHGVGPSAGWYGSASPEERRLLPFTPPSGHDFPVAVLAVFGVLLACMGLFAFQSTSRSQLMDERSLGDRGTVAAVAEQLATGGDPTNAVLAAFPAGTDPRAKTQWLERVSQLTSVAHVDTPVGRFELGELTATATADDAEAPSYALVVPRVAGRSEAAQELVEAIEATNAPVNAELSGVPVDAAHASASDALIVWATVLALAAVAGVAVFTLVGDTVLAAMAAGLRILGSSAVIGVYHLLVVEVSGAELQLAALVIAMGIGLFDLGFLRRLLVSHRVENTDVLLERALGSEGRAAATGLGLVAVASVGIGFADLAVVRRLAIVMVVGIVIEVVVGGWLLRPGLLGSRAISHFAAQPVRTALRALTGDAGENGRQAWVGVIDYLLHVEFSFQTDARVADLDRVYLTGTAVHHQATEHQESLISADLRIVGRSPQLRSVRVVSGADPITLAVTVDHPVRQLIDRDGKIVGVRKPERRSVMLWLVSMSDESYRIADSVELGAIPLALGVEPVADVAPPALGVSLE
jgi:hypothetical protein